MPNYAITNTDGLIVASAEVGDAYAVPPSGYLALANPMPQDMIGRSYLRDGVPTLCPPRPNPLHRWTGPVTGWMDVRPLAEVKASKNEEINAVRLSLNYSQFPHAGKLFSCDPLSRGDIDGMNGFVAIYGALPPGWPGFWKAADNTYLPIPDVAAWKDLYGSMVAAGSANFARSQALKARLQAATTIEEVQAIAW